MSYNTLCPEEKANFITHLIGVFASLFAIFWLLVLAIYQGTTIHVISFSIFGASLLFLYIMSSLYHRSMSQKWKKFLQRFDHIAIYVLIASTYTPFVLTVLHGTIGWTIFGIEWGLALIGIILKSFLDIDKYNTISTVFYLIMGWVVAIGFKQLLASANADCIAWLLGGGIAYTVGTIFFLWEKLKFSHAIWHLFVLAGSLCHVISIKYIL